MKIRRDSTKGEMMDERQIREEAWKEVAEAERERIVGLLRSLTNTQTRHAIWDKNKSGSSWEVTYGGGAPYGDGFDDFFEDDKSVAFLIALIRGETNE
jgi:hypothetical protein